ncbi:MAG: ABC transporter ATP-binding protein [Paracoccus sp. (in: a-proteobacteria)]|nr:ABC transporter ATP-binding protein [Paracoccus sp. (in: a-proteobacteria)]
MGLIETQDLAIGPQPGRMLARGLSLALAAGEIVSVLGRNGAGKTTLFRTLLGLIPPQGGRLALSGDDPARLDRGQIARRLSYVPQSLSVPFPYALEDFVLMGRTARLGPFAAPGRADREAALAAMERLGIAHLADDPVTRLSGGERQLALIARALAQGAPAMILDEPAAALDFGNRERLAQLMRGLADDGLGLIFSTHDPAQALRLADRVLTIGRDGAIRVGPTARMLTTAHLAALYALTEDEVRMAASFPVG